ncbi:TrkH family potassium uptake protein [Haladaptatus sp. DJG-WS-42]|uniref:TrkH family potassium uptake protein n=1 Tax=Haladaptatus sp. DJG-WS-42 TaxID=3120516 RepID=UPI0030CB8AAE
MVYRTRDGIVPTDLATIFRDVGALVLMEAALLALSAGVALAFGELYVAGAFVLAAAITAGTGGLARKLFDDAPAPRMKHGMVIAAAGWFATAIFGALPFLFAAYLVPHSVAASYVPAGVDYGSSLAHFRSPLHAFFESMSGWTGSGLTMAVHEPTMPKALLWWRSLIQWVGGVGVIVLTVSILARPGSGSYALYQSETREEKIHPSVVSTVRTVWKMFLGYTLLSIALLFMAIRLSDYGSALPTTEVAWQAINHAMTGLSTGGFSVTDNSIGTYDSPLIEVVLLPIMAIGAIAFPIHYLVLTERDLRHFVSDLQTRWLFILFGLGVVALTIQNLATLAPALSLRDSTFQFISALTCTGFQSAPIGTWSAGGKVILSGAMTMGGAAGSTVGGIKIIRGYTIGRGIRWQFRRVFLPANAVVTLKMDGRTLHRNEMEREFAEAAIVTLLWLILLIVGSVLLTNLAGPDFTYADALFEVASAQGNVGLSTGITGPTMPRLAEGMLILNMWVGRLEIIPILVFVRAAIYGLNP